MRFAKYWQKDSVTLHGKNGQSAVVTGWGASNKSHADARRHATERAELLANILEQQHTLTEYEYADDYIREEQLVEVKNSENEVVAILSRNSYGAVILNTERVVFGDIDIPTPGFMARLLRYVGIPLKDKQYYLKKIETYHKRHPSLVFLVYETCAGLRFIISNREMAPDSPEVNSLFKALKVDPLYRRLCHAQSCFRARLSPKPWRIGMSRPQSRFPRLEPEQQQDFDLWLHTYQITASNYSSAHFMAAFGESSIPDNIQLVLDIHNKYACQQGDAIGLNTHWIYEFQARSIMLERSWIQNNLATS